ncbi:hypothetical protein [Actinorugispora endophytica]|uniref:Uncharacterized protein n=1 Tax=Actinorugispora endophytica TaxID=1605990 RepID=A0A4R6ULS8_9ACTN|nr:hypothetical protein [Actinorugispora endophytica]TDQ48008.1 hypothetical protein EV190_12067 [Actinorugispora endophytica]
MDEVSIAIATAVAGRVAGDLDEAARGLLVRLRRALRKRFADRPPALEALEAARDENGEVPASVRALAGHLAAAREDDPEVRELADRLRPHLAIGGGEVVNTVHGGVSDTATVIQGRDMDFGPGGLRIGR